MRGLLVLVALAVFGVAPAEVVAKPSRSDILKRIEHIVVIYEENHSFDNLYGGWEGVEGLAAADVRHTLQIHQRGEPWSCLLQDDVNLTSPPLAVTCTDSTQAKPFASHFANAPFVIDALIPASAKTCPAPGAFAENGIRDGEGRAGGCTRDIGHRFYQEQYQLDHGMQNRYVTGSDAGGLVMGVYDTRRLPVYAYLHAPGHPRYCIADHFFQAAFGGSFLNHQWLIAAQTPVFAGAADDGGTTDLHSIVDSDGMPKSQPPLYTSPSHAALKDQALSISCRAATRPPPGVLCGDFAVNTLHPSYAPFEPGRAQLPPLIARTIGDRLDGKRVDWAWYSGGWSNANGDVGGPGWTNGTSAPCSAPNLHAKAKWPNCPDALFQFHHQPFNYYRAFDPATEEGRNRRTAHLRDEQEFLRLVSGSSGQCGLKAVSFVKPLGEENEHPGYASEPAGSDHLVALLRAIEGSACVGDTLIVIAYDEFGGQWDHVPPPGLGGAPGPHDAFGPGTRVPALVLSPFLQADFVVDHEPHDTTAILATIEHRFGLEPLGPRDAEVNDLASVFDAKPAP